MLNTLHMETFILDIEEPLETLPDLPEHSVRLIDECTIEADICRDEAVNDLFSDLSARGIRILSMRNKTNRLEQLFVRLLEGNGSEAS